MDTAETAAEKADEKLTQTLFSQARDATRLRHRGL
jgi:hypothetical protein